MLSPSDIMGYDGCAAHGVDAEAHKDVCATS